MNKNSVMRLVVLLAMLTSLLAPSTIRPAPVRAAWLEGWSYKMPVTITNTGAALSDYQVRISLDTGNFNFAQANSDGSDIRFTAADGTTLLPYWTESWEAGVNGILWVKAPSLPAGGSITIYMYYGNPGATTSASNGAETFYFFEDFESVPWTAWTKEGGPGTFIQSAEQAKRGSYSGKLETTSTVGSTVFSTASSLPSTNFVQEWDFYDDMDTTAFKMVRANYNIPGGQIGIGVWTGRSTTNYSYHNNSYGYTATTAARSAGWHKLAIRLTSDGIANFYVDGSASLGSLTGLPSTFNRVSVEGIPDGPTTYYVDDFRVRKFATPEPAVTLGVGGDPAVDVAIALSDAPDPLNINEELTYSIAVNNYGDLDATDVTVSDPLPAAVSFVSAAPSQGTCTGSTTIT